MVKYYCESPERNCEERVKVGQALKRHVFLRIVSFVKFALEAQRKGASVKRGTVTVRMCVTIVSVCAPTAQARVENQNLKILLCDIAKSNNFTFLNLEEKCVK